MTDAGPGGPAAAARPGRRADRLTRAATCSGSASAAAGPVERPAVGGLDRPGAGRRRRRRVGGLRHRPVRRRPGGHRHAARRRRTGHSAARRPRLEGGRRPTVLVVGDPLDATVAPCLVGAGWQRGAPGALAPALVPRWPARDAPAAGRGPGRGGRGTGPGGCRPGPVHVLLAGTTRRGAAAGRRPGRREPAGARTRLARTPSTPTCSGCSTRPLATAPAASRLRWVDGDLAGHLHRPWTGAPGTPTAQLDWAVARADRRRSRTRSVRGRGRSTATCAASYPRPTPGWHARCRLPRPWRWRSRCSRRWREDRRGRPRDPARRRPEDRHVVPPGRAVPQPRVPRRAGHPLPRRPVRRALPGRARPDAAALGRARDAGRSAPGTGSPTQVRGWPGTAIISHEILAHRLPRAGRAARWSRSVRRDTEVHVVLSARDLVRQIPAEWQENVKHRRHGDLRASSSTRSRDPARASDAGVLVLGRPGGARHPRPLGRRRCRPSRCTWSRCRRPGAPRDLLWQRFAGVLGLDADEPRARGHRPGEPVARRARDRAGPPDQPAAQRRRRPTSDYRQFVRELLAHQTLSRRPDSAAAAAAARRARLGRASSRRSLGRASWPRGGTTWSATSTSWCPQRRSPFVDPDHPDETEVAEVGARGRCDGAARARPPGCATSRSSCTRSIGDLQERDRAVRAATRPYRVKRRLVREAGTNPVARPGSAAYRALARQELAVGVAADLPGRVGVGAGADAARRPPAPGGRPWSRSACRRPW